MHLTTIILLVLALYVAQIFLQETSRFGFDLKGIVGNRDVQPEPSVVAARLDRAKNNLLKPKSKPKAGTGYLFFA